MEFVRLRHYSKIVFITSINLFCFLCSVLIATKMILYLKLWGDSNFCLENTDSGFKLKSNHSYYYQVN